MRLMRPSSRSFAICFSTARWVIPIIFATSPAANPESDFSRLRIFSELFSEPFSERSSKNFLGMDQNHQYTKVSVEKRVARIIFLAQKLIYLLDELNIDKRAIPYW